MTLHRVPWLFLLTLLLLHLGACTARGPAPNQQQSGQETPVQAPVQARPEPRPLTATAGALQVEVVPQFEAVQLARLPLDLNVLVRLRGEGKATGERPPLDLAVVLDRSSSMGGDKLLAVKQAALDLLKELRPVDRLTLVSYSDGVELLTERLTMDPAGVEASRAKVLPISAQGGTALGPGLVRGLELLEQAKRPEQDLAHLLLFSDGQANVGEQRPDVLGARAAQAFKSSVSVSTLGVGLDYNEDLMTRLADQGGGRYHFIKGADEVARVLADELAGLVSTSATGITLELRPGAGVSVSKVFGYPSTAEQGVTRVSIGSIGAQQVREVLVRLRIDAGTGEKLALGVLAAAGNDLTQGGKQVRTEIALALRTTADEAEASKSERTEVTVRVAEVESSEQLQAAARAAETGQYDVARQVLDASLQKLEVQAKATPSSKLTQQIEDLKQAAASVDHASTSVEADKVFKKELKAKAYKKMK